MNADLIIGIGFGLSVFLLAAAGVLWLVLHWIEQRREVSSFLQHIATPFRVFLILFFFSTACALCPANYLDPEHLGDAVYTVSSSLIYAFRLFFMEGDFAVIYKGVVGAAGLTPWFGTCYLVYLALFHLVAPVFTLSFILSFIRDFSSSFRFSVSFRSDLYLFSELNERSLALAEDVLRDRREQLAGFGKRQFKDKKERKEAKRALRRKRLVVFTDVFRQNEERSDELFAAAKRMGALLLRKDVTEVGAGLGAGRRKKIYLIGDNEDENIQQALTLINKYSATKADNEKLEFYIFSSTAESEALLTSVYNKSEKTRPQRMKIRRFNENRSLALREMTDNPIFDGAIEEDKVRRIGVLLIGLGGYGTELFKAVCWCAQMPGYELTVHVFDKDSAEDKIKSLAPELIEKNHDKTPNEAHYDIYFHNGFDTSSGRFAEELAKIGDVTRVYVSLGDDERNIETALRVRTILQREHGIVPPIFPIVYNSSKCDSIALANIAGEGGRADLYSMEHLPYKIYFIGDLRARYTLECIERKDLEAKALDFHLDWDVKEKKRAEEAQKHDEVRKIEASIVRHTEEYFHFEYYRNSSMAQAAYFALREKYALIGEGEDRDAVLRDYEHRRWNAYMRADGYKCGTNRVHIAKTHPFLVPYTRLDDTTKLKDKKP